MPVRVQRKRTKGWRMPRGVVYVGCHSRYGTPFVVAPDACRTATIAVASFRRMLQAREEEFVRTGLRKPGLPYMDDLRKALRGKDLACWCPLDAPCHADVLLEIANAEKGQVT